MSPVRVITSPNSSLPLDFSSKFLYAVISPMYATFPDHLCLTAFNALIMVDYTLWGYSLCNCSFSSCDLLFPRPDILLVVQFKRSLALFYFAERQIDSHAHTQHKVKLGLQFQSFRFRLRTNKNVCNLYLSNRNGFTIFFLFSDRNC